MKDTTYYVMVLRGGCELDNVGPFDRHIDRDAEAKIIWNNNCDPNNGDNVFWCDINSNGEVRTGSYISGDLDKTE
jgi:hypothetical protein